MATFMRIISISLLSIIIVFSIAGCSPSVSQEEYDSLKKELSDSKAQLAAVQDQLAEATGVEALYQDLIKQYEELKRQDAARSGEIQSIQTEFDELNTRYEALTKQYDARLNEVQNVQAQYADLKNEFDELKRQYGVVTEDTTITEDEINQVIFNLINQERLNNGVPELLWGKNLYSWARLNSRQMAEQGVYKYSEWSSWQEIFWAAGYNSVDRIANGALLTWKNNDYRYRYNIINRLCTYGAVGTYQLGEIFYVTYMASTYE